MQVNFAYTRHTRTKECAMGMARRQQREAVVASALALHCQFMVHGDALEKVEVFNSLPAKSVLAGTKTCTFW
jgi:hypothetical protein